MSESSLANFLKDIGRTKSPKTFRTYKALLGPFDSWLQEKGMNINGATYELAYDYLERVRTRSGEKLKNSAKNVFISALKRWARWRMERLPIGVTPEELRQTLEDRQRLERVRSMDRFTMTRMITKKALTLAELENLLRFSNERDRDVVWALFYFGLRLGERKGAEIDMKRRILKVMTYKRRELVGERILPFDDYTAGVLKRWGGLLGGELHDSTIQKAIMKYDKRMGFHLHPHMARHTFETEMLRSLQAHLVKSGVDVGVVPIKTDLIVKKLLGHAVSGDMAMIYGHPTEQDLRWGMEPPVHYMSELEGKI